jgi:hypothetical protein
MNQNRSGKLQKVHGSAHRGVIAGLPQKINFQEGFTPETEKPRFG